MTSNEHSLAETETSSRRPTRFEIVAIVGVITMGLTLRVWFPGRMAVEHFDEGVYASNVWFGAEDGYQYPFRHLYAPPLFPGVVEWSIILLGSHTLGPFLISLIAGVATIGLVWWVGRAWFGPLAGLASAVLVAFSDYHILYSRMALTDVLLGFWLLLAVYWMWRSFHNGHVRWLVGASFATAAAWWTKYNGWLPIAIGISGSLAWAVVVKRQRRDLVNALRVNAMIALAAFLLWCPVLVSLQSRGGYAAVAANHRGYLVGWSGWVDSLLQQMANLCHIEGGLTYCGLILAIAATTACCIAAGHRFTWNKSAGATDRSANAMTFRSRDRKLLYLSIAGLLSSVVGVLRVIPILPILGLLGMVLNLDLTRRSDTSRRRTEPDTSLASWTLLAWFTGLLLATPFYRPYPRLMLPSLIAVWLGAGAAIAWAVRAILSTRQADAMPNRHVGALTLSGIVMLATVGVIGTALARQGVLAWQPHTGPAKAAALIADKVTAVAQSDSASSNQDPIVYVYGEPALFFHLRDRGLPLVAPVGDLQFAQPGADGFPNPTFLVAGPHAFREGSPFPNQLAASSPHLIELAAVDCPLSDIVRLNDVPADQLASAPTEAIHLYRLVR